MYLEKIIFNCHTGHQKPVLLKISQVNGGTSCTSLIVHIWKCYVSSLCCLHIIFLIKSLYVFRLKLTTCLFYCLWNPKCDSSMHKGGENMTIGVIYWHQLIHTLNWGCYVCFLQHRSSAEADKSLYYMHCMHYSGLCSKTKELKLGTLFPNRQLKAITTS